MLEKTVKVAMTEGTEERPVAVLVQIASQYESQIHLVSDDKKINAKSIMGMMSRRSQLSQMAKMRKLQ